MDRSIDKIAEALRSAMQAENEGCYFYEMAARNTEDPKGKKVFQYMADEEKKHFNFLKQQYGVFLKTGKADGSIKMKYEPRAKEDHPIFTPEIRERIGNAHYEMTALSIGIQLEMTAVKHYKTAAEDAGDDPVMRAFFEDLADWEQEHLDILQMQADMLRDDYWNKGGFAPF